MEPTDRKRRIVIALIGAAIALAFLGNFFWSFFKGFFPAFNGANHGSKAPLLIFGGFFLVMALAVVFSVVRGIRRLTVAPTTPPPREERPWLKRADWAAGKIKSSATSNAGFFWLWSVLALALSAPAVWHIPQEWQKGNHLILVALVFPVAAFYLIGYSIVQWRSRRRFGDTFFELAQIPAPLGGSLDGMIQTGARLKPEHGLHLKLSCIRRTVSGAGNNRSVQENILWQDEKVFAPDASLPEQEPGRSGIPVFFRLPADQPECHARGNESVFWRLEARAKLSGPDFRATFEVPVFQVAGAGIAETANEPDPTAALQMPVADLRRDEHSRIRVNDVPGGREFYFPAARNLGTAFFTTLFMLVFNGAAVFMYRAHAPMLFPIVFGLIGVLLILGTFNLWFQSSRVTINSTNVQWTKRWLVFSRTRDFSAGDCAQFATKTGMQSGSTVFTDIKLVRVGADAEFAEKMKNFEGGQQVGQLVAGRFRQAAGPSGVTVASSIANAAEAGWLVKEMNKALGRVA
jgi:hypothetical protein